MIKTYYVSYVGFALAGIIGFALGGNVGTHSSHQDTLKLCNQKPLECKFKYDILMYNETGKVPYTAPPAAKPEKK
jgi:hypothetical protein